MIDKEIPSNVRPLRAGILPAARPATPSVSDIIGGAGGRQQALALNTIANRTPARSKVDYDGSLLPVIDYRVPKMATVEKWICSACGKETDGHSDFGSTKDPDGRVVPCSTCYPPVKKARARKKVDRLIQDAVKRFNLADTYNLPIDAEGIEIEWFVGDQRGKSEVIEFIKGETSNLFLYGDPGRGKTGLAISALHAMTRKGIQCLFLPMIQYISLLREDADYQTQYKTEIKDIAHMVQCLFLDDLGVETPTKATIRDTQELIEARHAAGLRTFITSNMSPEGLGYYWELPEFARSGFQPGSRIISRVGVDNSRGWYKKYQLTGVDLR